MTEIFVPMFYMMCLTATVFLFSTGIRLKEIYLASSDTAVDGENTAILPLTMEAWCYATLRETLQIYLSFQFCFTLSAFQYL